MQPLDYGLSFICNPSPANSVRFWIESRTRITDPKRGTKTDYYQCASCKSEHTFAAKHLLHDDNYDFLPIFGGEDLLIFRRHARLTPTYRQLYKAVDVWGAPIFKPREVETAVVLDTWEKIQGATAAGVPIVKRRWNRYRRSGLLDILRFEVPLISQPSIDTSQIGQG